MENYKGQIYVILSAILFGFMPLLTRITYSYGSNAYMTSFGRFFIGSLILLIINLVRKEDMSITKIQLKRISLLAFLQGFTPVCLYMSYSYIDSGLSTTLHFTYPIFVMLLSWLLFKEKLNRKQLLCLFLCILGIVLLYKPGSVSSTTGMLLAVLSGVIFSFYVTLLGRSHLENIPIFVMSFYVCFIASIMILLYSILTNHIVFMNSINGYIALGALAFMATVLAVVLFQKGILLCGGIKASLLSTFEPFTSMVIGILIYHEIITFKIGLGMFMILFSTILLVIKKE